MSAKAKKRLRVVVVDDSAICRAQLCDILEADGDIEVVGEADKGSAAIALVAEKKPDLATIDWRMPGMDGLEVIEHIMARTPLPILVITGQPSGGGLDLAFESLRRGALDLCDKMQTARASQHALLRAQVRRLAAIPVVRHVGAPNLRKRSAPHAAPAPAQPGVVRPIVALGASAGGPGAVAAVLGALPGDFAACVAIVQHLPPGFAKPFADFLQSQTAMKVMLVDKPTRITPSTVLVAGDGLHLVAGGQGELVPSDDPALGGYRPSVSALFFSLVKAFGAAAIGVVLSGMGDDGTSGLLAMRKAGALTIAQDEQSSAVYGMPRAAAEAGAAAQILPLGEIAAALVASVGPARTKPRAQGGAP